MADDFTFPSETDKSSQPPPALTSKAEGGDFTFPSETESKEGFLGHTKQAAAEAISSFKSAADEAPEPGAFPSLTRIPRMVGAAAKLAGAPVTGAVKTVSPYIAGPMASGIQAVGEPVAKALNPNAALPSHEEVTRQIEPEVETALGLTMPGKMKVPIGPTTVGAQEIAEASARLKVPVPIAAATRSVPVQSVAGSLKDIPLVGSPIVNASKKALAGLDQAAKDVSAGYGSGDQFIAGQAAKQGIQNWVESGSKAVASRLYDAVDPLVDQKALRPLYETERVIKDIETKRMNAGLSAGDAVGVVDKAVRDPLGLNYQGIKTLRSHVGELVDTGILPPSMSKTELSRVYGALTEDLRGHILDAGGSNALQTFDKANDVYSQIADRRKTLSTIIGVKADVAPEQVVDRLFAMANAKGRADITKLAQARKAMGPDAWNDVTAAVVNRMGRATPGAEFSGDRFVTAWNNLSPDGKRLLFNSTGQTGLAKSIEDIATLSQAHKGLMSYGNPSGTGRTTTGAALAAGLWAEPITALSSAVSSHVLARILARPVTAQQVARWSAVYNAARQAPNVGRMGSLTTASGNLARTVNRELGTNFTGTDFMRQLQGPSPAGAGEQNQQNVPGPPPQKKHGGRIGEKQNPAHGGHIREKFKLAHAAVGYVVSSTHLPQKCGRCTMFLPPSGCTLVQSPIKAGGWCRRFEKEKHAPSE